MPNLLAGEMLYPELIQSDATGPNLAQASLDLLNDGKQLARIKARLAEVIASLGGPGASKRAALAIQSLIQ
jgi:lipid A disaccharide synthetase